MRIAPKARAATIATAISLAAHARPLTAQSLLDRPDNISADWIGNSGTLYFNFVHRFSESAPPERKVTNFPTFLIAAGIASRGLVGVNYATNSPLAARYPNEYEFFGRYAFLQQDDGAPFDLGGQIDYNLAVRGVDGDVSIAHREGPLRLVAVTRLIADTLGGNRRRFSFGGGGTFRFGRFVALAGDVATLANRANGETVAWSAGLHLALPNTPHTLSLHVSNATTSTLQGLARGGDTKRYGFEFTIPIHMSRFFSNPEPASALPEPPPSAAAPTGGDSLAPVTAAPAHATVGAPSPLAAPATAPATPVPADTTALKARAELPVPRSRASPSGLTPTVPPVARKIARARIKGQAFIPDRLEIAAGTTVQWKNLDALIHTVTAADRSFNSGVIAADGSYSHTFTKPGTYPVYCMAHPFMKATIIVK